MTINLVGPTGFLGENFCRLNNDIVTIGRRPPLNKTMRHIGIASNFDFSVLDSENLDNIIFLIGSSDHEVINNHPTLAFEMNVLPLAKFLDYCSKRRRKPRKVITFTTMLQYDSKLMRLPCDETQPIKSDKNNYVLSKFTAERVSSLYRQYFDIIDIRLSNVYGPTHLKRPDIIPTIVNKLLTTGRAQVWTKKPIRDFVYVEDVVHAVVQLFDTTFSGPINVGSGTPRSVGDICSIMENITGVHIDSEDRSVTGHMKYYHDLTLLRSLLLL